MLTWHTTRSADQIDSDHRRPDDPLALAAVRPAAALSAVAKARSHSLLLHGGGGERLEGRRSPLQLGGGGGGVGGADAAALVEAVTAALLPELRRLAGAVDALAADVAALRSERG